MAKPRLFVRRVIVLSAVIVLCSAAIIWGALRACLPALEGHIQSTDISAPLRIVRDKLGVVTIEAASRRDVAWALGYAHASDRFFQMDLLRRNSAGEMAELIGAAALPLDREHRLHRLRLRAHQALANMPVADRAVLDHYVAGVNAGLNALHGRPFEYWLLRTTPKAWTEEDSLLVIYSMYFELQGHQPARELSRGWLAENCNDDQLSFLLPTHSKWDAPLDGNLPDGKVEIPAHVPAWWRGETTEAALTPVNDVFPGSNNFAIAGSKSRTGSAIVANDMHLGLSLPNTWYRAVLRWQESAHGIAQVVGVTLPGTPAVVAGSNGRIAWGFTNSYGDWTDLVRVERDPADRSKYRTAKGWETLDTFKEIIAVNHGDPETLLVQESRFGPIWKVAGESFAVRWAAHDAAVAVNFGLMAMEQAKSASDAIKVGQRAGIPAQNLVVGDREGHIGWTIAGPMPERVEWGDRNTVPLAGEDPHVSWSSYLMPGEHPSILDPKSGILWTANNRQLAGEKYALIGDGGADLGARAKQIRDDLLQLKNAKEVDLLNIQLDNRALLLAGWHDRLLKLLSEDNVKGHPDRAEARKLINGWSGSAAASDAGYQIVRAWRDAVYHGLFDALDHDMKKIDRNMRYSAANPRWEVVAAALLDQAPETWLPLGYPDWNSFEIAQLDHVIAALTAEGRPLREARWGVSNTSHIAHPFVRFMPWLAWLLAAPADELSGDNNVPRVLGKDFGASERFVISPGHEDHGIFHMPGGQSGNPLSPFFLAGHESWVKGEATPLLPTSQDWVLNIEPRH